MKVQSYISLVAVFASLFFCSVSRSEEPDAMSVEWEGKKPCEKLHEDDQIRILRCTFAPGTKHLRHQHPPGFTYWLTGGKNQVVDASGVRVAERPAGFAASGAAVPWHEITNVGDSTLAFLVVEMKYKK